MARSELLDRFETYLTRSGFQPGDLLPGEVELALRFEVSRGTIREVLTHLTLQGVLERRPNRGTCLAAPDAEAIGRSLAFQLRWFGCGREELKDARIMLEKAVIPEAVRRITPAAVDRLNRLNDRLERAADDPAAADRLDKEFHLELFRATGSRIMPLFAEVLTLLFEREEYRRPFHSPEAIRHTLDVHRAMTAALAAGDAAELSQLIDQHLSPL